MTPEETRVFKLLDEYSRDRHKCLLTEMFPNEARSAYTLCFRPTGVEKESPNRYACRYLHVEASEVETAAGEGRLISSITSKLDSELEGLGRLT